MRLWIGLLVGSMAVLWSLQLVPADIDPTLAFITAMASLGLSLMGVGWVFNRLALKMIGRLIREATIWERAGNFNQAEKIFKKAVALFDSFLMSPAFKKKRSQGLMAHMARFYLARQDRSPAAEVFITACLRQQPRDRELAEEWLQQASAFKNLTPDQQELAYRIGEAQPDNDHIQRLLAGLYVTVERIDYQALQAYRRILDRDPAGHADLTGQLAELFYSHRRTDEWALKAYVHAYARNARKTHLLNGMAACLHWVDGANLPPAVLRQAEDFLSGVPDSRRKEMHEGFAPPARPPLAPESRTMQRRLETARRLLAASWRTTLELGRSIAAGASFLWSLARTGTRRIRAYPHLKPVLKWAGIGIASAGLALLAVNTVSFLLSPRQEIMEPEKPPAVIVTDPFTLQVAAYLKKEHAERYVRQLKEAGLDAYWTEAKGIKSRWYQVRLSHFADKASARAYGESLKAKGLIDDFYVANYDRAAQRP